MIDLVFKLYNGTIMLDSLIIINVESTQNVVNWKLDARNKKYCIVGKGRNDVYN